MKRTPPTPVRFRPAVTEQVNEAAVRLGLSRNKLITSAVEQFLAENTKTGNLESFTSNAFEGYQEIKLREVD